MRLKAEIKRTNNSPKALNHLGVLYAPYGLMDRAEAQFKKALQRGDYSFPLIKMGNI